MTDRQARVFNQLPSTAPTPLDELLQTEDRDRLRRAIEDLPPRERFILNARYEISLPFTVIARHVKVTPCRVGQLHKAAIARLRQALEPNAPNAPTDNH